MQGKRGLIMVLANDKSLAWGIAQKLSEHGAELAFSYQGEMMEKRVRPLAEQLGTAKLIDCAVYDTAAIDSAFADLARDSPHIDFAVHTLGIRSDERRVVKEFVSTCRSRWSQLHEKQTKHCTI